MEPARRDDISKPAGPPSPGEESGRGDDRPQFGRVVAFTAKLSVEHSYPRHAGVLRFSSVVANEGEAYDPGTGIFTCPRRGVYHFAAHMSVYGRAQCAISKNGEVLVTLYHTTLPNKCSQVASVGSVVRLDEGDRVWVDLWGGDRNDFFATCDNDCAFVGFYLG